MSVAAGATVQIEAWAETVDHVVDFRKGVTAPAERLHLGPRKSAQRLAGAGRAALRPGAGIGLCVNGGGDKQETACGGNGSAHLVLLMMERERRLANPSHSIATDECKDRVRNQRRIVRRL